MHDHPADWCHGWFLAQSLHMCTVHVTLRNATGLPDLGRMSRQQRAQRFQR